MVRKVNIKLQPQNMARKQRPTIINNRSNPSKNCTRFKCYVFTIGLIMILLTLALFLFSQEKLTYFVNIYSDIYSDIRELTNCQDEAVTKETRGEDHDDFLIHYNAVPADKSFRCHQSVTLTLEADYTSLGMLVDLVDRWNGPISVAVYAPNVVFAQTIDSISYLRNCENLLVKEYVTFHIYYDKNQVPKVLEESVYTIKQMVDEYSNCLDIIPPYKDSLETLLFQSEYNKTEYTNVGRNIAIDSAQTHFLLSSEIEFQPSLDIIPKFLQMLQLNPELEQSSINHIYALPLVKTLPLAFSPRTKEELQELYEFENYITVSYENPNCPLCDKIPEAGVWFSKIMDDKFDIFKTVKRVGEFEKFQPLFIGTQDDVFFDERVSNNEDYDKAIEAFYLCLLDYDIMILDDAFLVHTDNPFQNFKRLMNGLTSQANNLQELQEIVEEVEIEMKHFYGRGDRCVLIDNISETIATAEPI